VIETRSEIYILKGKAIRIKVLMFGGHDLVVSGKYLRIAGIKEEWDEDINDPGDVLSGLKSEGIEADIFTFMQRLPESKPKFAYPLEWDNVAALPIDSYESWLMKRLHRNHRNKIKLALKRGVTVRQVDFNDELVLGIQRIYNETPVRQGRPYWNYGMGFDDVKYENSQFMDRAVFFGAFLDEELIGYIRIVFTDRFARTMGILSMARHQDKAPTNLLMAKAVEHCSTMNIPYLVYAKYDYGNLGNESLMNFKKYNGFESIVLPRYFVPLNTKGRLALSCNLHHGVKGIIPKEGIAFLKGIRNRWYQIRNVG